MKLRKHDIGYNASDKNYGPVLYSREKYTEQCKLHLFDGKGTYEKISQTIAKHGVSIITIITIFFWKFHILPYFTIMII